MLFLGRMEDAMSRVIAHHPPPAITTSDDNATHTFAASSISTTSSTSTTSAAPATPTTPAIPGGITFTPVTPVRPDSGDGSRGLVGDVKLPLVVITTTNALTHSDSDSDSRSGSPSGGNSGSALLGEQFSFLAHLPLTIHLVVEEGHGTKLLPSGELRLDCRASPSAVQELIATKCLESLELSAKHKVRGESEWV